MGFTRILRIAVPVMVVAALLPAQQAAAAPFRLEAEKTTISQGVVQSNYAGYSGTGFVNPNDVVGSFVQWTFTVPAAGVTRLTFRFANGTAAARPADISLNGAVVADELLFHPTGSWATWRNRVISTTLRAGANTVRIASTTAAGAPNLDAIDIDTAAPPLNGTPQTPTTVTTGLSLPWAMSFFPDGLSALVTERNSFRVSRVTQNGARTTLGTVPNSVTTGGEGGLMGVAVSPTWNGTTDQQVFFFHTSNDGGLVSNRIIRMNYNGTTLSGRTVILSGIKSNTVHNGGQLKFGPDGLLYATTGDAQDTTLPQNTRSLSGKILRLTRTGAVPAGNPFGNHVYSYGHRNPQGLAWDSDRRLWSSELGAGKADELNLIVAGHNYGWPNCEGPCSTPGYDNPKRTWVPAEASPSSLAIINNVAYVAALRGQRVWRVELNGNSAGTTSAFFNGTLGRIRAIVQVPGAQSLWIGTSNTTNDRIVRSDIR